jgi:hypothetical protein
MAARKAQSQDPQNLAYDIVDYAKLAIVAMVCIYVVYQVAMSLIGQLPAQIASVILGIAFIFVFVVSKQFRESIMNLGKQRK